MKIALFSENLLGILSSIGGAEIYTLKLAECLLEKYSVTIFTLGNSETLSPDHVLSKYNITQKINIVVIPFVHSKNLLIDIPKRIILWRKMRKLIEKNYDVFVNTTHNRLLGFKRIKSVHLIHFPVKNYKSVLPFPFGNMMNNLYKKSYKLFITNSCFTQFHTKKEWGVESVVLNPPIDMNQIEEDELKQKERLLLMVGRIVPDKRIKEIVDFFESIKNIPELQNYKLIIAGNKDSKEIELYKYLKQKEKEGSVLVCEDLPYKDLVTIYKRSLFFIHAKGYLESEDNPMKMEHFGMTTVEAMANGCIPFVINKAGQKEIVEQNVSGFLWNDLSELQDYLIKVIDKPDVISVIQKKAIERSTVFLTESFKNKALLLFSNL